MPKTSDCQHGAKMRLLGYDARLWQCAGSDSLNTTDDGCGELFVEGRTRHGEQPWLSLGVFSRFDICCGVCLDGFCTSLDHHACQVCGRTTARPVARDYQEEVRQDSILRGGMPDTGEAAA